MDVERGTSNTWLIPARDLYAHYLFVFQSAYDPDLYQYAITENTGPDGSSLLLTLTEQDSATAVDGEVTLGVGDWKLSVYGQASSTNLDASLSDALVHTELVRVTSDDTIPADYPPEGGGSGSAPDSGRCRYIRVCGDPSDGQVPTWDEDEQEYVPATPSGGGGGGGVTDHGALTGLGDDDHTQYHNNARGDARYYTQGQVDTALSGKANTSHSHAISDVTGLQTALDGKQAAGSYAAASHTHAISDVTGLQTALDGKASTASLATLITEDPGAGVGIIESGTGVTPYVLKNAKNGTLTEVGNNTGSFQVNVKFSGAGKFPYSDSLGATTEGDITAAGRALLDDADASAQRTTLGLGTLATQNGTFSGTSSGTNTGDQDLSGYATTAAVAAGYQPLDADLTAIAGLTSAADKGIQFTGSGAAGTFDLTAAGKALLDDADAAAQRTTLGVVAMQYDSVGSGQTTTSTSLANITGLSLDIAANASVSVVIEVQWENSSTSGGPGLGLNGSAAATYVSGRWESTQGTGNYAQPITAYNATTNQTTCPAANTVYYAILHARIVNGGSASTITPQIARGGSGTLTIRSASITIIGG